jgi:hypothetical protein
VVQSSIEFSPNALNTEFKVTATSWVRTPFLGILNALNAKDSEAGAPAVCQGNFYAFIKIVTTATAALCPSRRALWVPGATTAREKASRSR